MSNFDVSKFDVSNFDLNAILRGAQLTLVGGQYIVDSPSRCLLSLCIVNRALQNPGIFTSTHYRQAAIAVAAGIAIRLILSVPVRGPSSRLHCS